MRIPKAFLAVVVASLALAFTACGDDDNGDSGETGTAGAGTTTTSTEPSPEPSGNAPAPSGEAVRSAKVEIVEFAYDPDPVTIQVGGKVTWINRDSAPHTVTAEAGSFDIGTIEQGKLGSESFKELGTYSYFCRIHPDMYGSIEVVEG